MTLPHADKFYKLRSCELSTEMLYQKVR